MQTSGNTVPLELKTHRFQELDSLRGLASATVVFSHYLLVFHPSHIYDLFVSTPLHLFVNGPEAVILFFVLSGFVLSSLWSRSAQHGYASYGLKRLLRLCLPFYAALLIAAFFDVHLFNSRPTTNAWINQTWSMKPTVSMLLHTALTDTRWAEQLNTAFWTVTYEIRISLIFPLLYWVAMRVPTWKLIAGLIAIQAAVPVLHSLDNVVDADLLAAVVEFTVGILLFRELPNLLRWLYQRSRRQQVALVLGSLLLYGIALQAPAIRTVDTTTRSAVLDAPASNQPRKAPVDRSARAKLGRGLAIERDVARLQLGIVASASLMLCAIGLPGIRGWLRHPALLRMGALSYSTYLLHGTVLFILIRLYYGRLPFLYFLPPYLCAVYIVSELFHWAVDQPAIFLGRRAEKWLLAVRGRETRETVSSAS